MVDAASLQQKIDRIQDLPTLPNVVKQILEIIRDPQANASDVGDIISHDPPLTARTLKLVNSAFYGFPRKIDSITRAIVILGFNKIRNLALTATVFDVFKKRSAVGMKVEALWEHCLAVAIMTEELYKLVRSDRNDDAFVAGLLHDLGKMIFIHYLPQEFTAVMGQVKSGALLISEAEEKVTTTNHAEVGHWLSERWNFPPPLDNAIRMHHKPALAKENRDLVHVVHAADILVRAVGMGDPGDALIPCCDPMVWQNLDLSEVVVEQAYAAFGDSIRKAHDFFELIYA